MASIQLNTPLLAPEICSHDSSSLVARSASVAPGRAYLFGQVNVANETRCLASFRLGSLVVAEQFPAEVVPASASENGNNAHGGARSMIDPAEVRPSGYILALDL